jgi:hypothetical protein
LIVAGMGFSVNDIVLARCTGGRHTDRAAKAYDAEELSNVDQQCLDHLSPESALLNVDRTTL